MFIHDKSSHFAWKISILFFLFSPLQSLLFCVVFGENFFSSMVDNHNETFPYFSFVAVVQDG